MSLPPVRVLMFSKDPSLLDDNPVGHATDARQRHIYYCQRLRACAPGSEMRIVTYTTRRTARVFDEPTAGLRLIGTRSFHRVTYVLDVLRRLPAALQDGWRPSIVTTQTPLEEGVLGLAVARVLGASYIPQLHFDVLSAQWKAQSPLNGVRRWAMRHIVRRADAIRVASRALGEKIAPAWDIPRERLLVAPVGVDFTPATGEKAAFKAKLDPSFAEKKVVLFVGRLSGEKNLELWVNVAIRAAKAREDAVFLLVGSGAEKQRLQQIAEQSGLSDRILFLGPRDHRDLPSIYAAADVFLLTSHYEGFGRVVLEALLSGVPVVSTACTGPEDLIEHARSGYLLPAGDLAGLSAAVLDLLADEAKAREFGAAGRASVTGAFSLETLAERLIGAWIARSRTPKTVRS